MTIEIIKKAIENKKPIQFEYNKEEKVRGLRVGNPHCLFIHTSTNKTEIDLYQTDGVSDSNLKEGLPWRKFIVDFIDNISILENKPSFEIAEGYNPDSPIYENFIAKV